MHDRFIRVLEDFLEGVFEIYLPGDEWWYTMGDLRNAYRWVCNMRSDELISLFMRKFVATEEQIRRILIDTLPQRLWMLATSVEDWKKSIKGVVFKALAEFDKIAQGATVASVRERFVKDSQLKAYLDSLCDEMANEIIRSRHGDLNTEDAKEKFATLGTSSTLLKRLAQYVHSRTSLARKIGSFADNLAKVSQARNDLMHGKTLELFPLSANSKNPGNVWEEFLKSYLIVVLRINPALSTLQKALGESRTVLDSE